MTNKDCLYCNGTGEDQDFGGACTSCKGGTEAPTAKTPPSADEMTELAEWLREQTWSDFAQSLANFFLNKGYLTEKQFASAKRMKAKCDAKAPKVKVQETNPITAPGMFEQAGVIYKVKESKTGNLYAMVLRNGSFEYAAGMIRRLRDEDRLTMETAKRYGRETGQCCCCARTLTNPDSIAAGIGPICASGL